MIHEVWVVARVGGYDLNLAGGASGALDLKTWRSQTPTPGRANSPSGAWERVVLVALERALARRCCRSRVVV